MKCHFEPGVGVVGNQLIISDLQVPWNLRRENMLQPAATSIEMVSSGEHSISSLVLRVYQ